MLELLPVGVVKHWTEEERTDLGHPKDTARIEIYEPFSDGLEGVERCDALWVLYWMHNLSEEDRKILRVHPMGDRTKEKRGVFALHSPARPNPIGMTRVELIERSGNVLIVRGLDALDGSPVVDIKSG